MASEELTELRKSLEAFWVGQPASEQHGLGCREAAQTEASSQKSGDTFNQFSSKQLARIGGLAMPKEAAQVAELGPENVTT